MKYHFEIWADCEGFPGYEVSTLGRVRGKDRTAKHKYGTRVVPGKVLKGSYEKGYHRVHLGVNGKRVKMRVHRLVAITFLGQAAPSKVIDHIDDDKANNRVDNLRWVTQVVNMEKYSRDTRGRVTSGS